MGATLEDKKIAENETLSAIWPLTVERGRATNVFKVYGTIGRVSSQPY
jgi:hypothetical protein